MYPIYSRRDCHISRTTSWSVTLKMPRTRHFHTKLRKIKPSSHQSFTDASFRESTRKHTATVEMVVKLTVTAMRAEKFSWLLSSDMLLDCERYIEEKEQVDWINDSRTFVETYGSYLYYLEHDEMMLHTWGADCSADTNRWGKSQYKLGQKWVAPVPGRMKEWDVYVRLANLQKKWMKWEGKGDGRLHCIKAQY